MAADGVCVAWERQGAGHEISQVFNYFFCAKRRRPKKIPSPSPLVCISRRPSPWLKSTCPSLRVLAPRPSSGARPHTPTRGHTLARTRPEGARNDRERGGCAVPGTACCLRPCADLSQDRCEIPRCRASSAGNFSVVCRHEFALRCAAVDWWSCPQRWVVLGLRCSVTGRTPAPVGCFSRLGCAPGTAHRC
jgi:hypothetical protein